jgi:uncharacterized delta-60 repeat protein
MSAKTSFDTSAKVQRLATASTRCFPDKRRVDAAAKQVKRHPQIESLEKRALLTAGTFDIFVDNPTQNPSVITDDIPGGNNTTAGVAVTDRGASVVVSTFTPKNGKPPELIAELFQPTGLIDPSFGVNGRTIIRIGALGTEARAVTLDSSGRILIAAAADTTPSGPSGELRRDDSSDDGNPISQFHDWAIVRLTPAGRLDKTFAGKGFIQMDVGSISQNDQPPLTMAQIGSFAQDEPSQIIALSDGKFLVNGFAPEVSFGDGSGKDLSIFENTRFVVRRFNANGSIDTTYGTNGDAEQFAGRAMAVGPTGDVYVAGGRRVIFESSGVSDFSDITHFLADGSIDTHFGDNGTVSYSNSANSFSGGTPGIAVQPDDKLVVGLTHVIRFNTNGTLDTSFSGDGFAPSGIPGTISKILIDDAGNYIVVGTKQEFRGSGNAQKEISHLILSRVLQNGTLDTSFGSVLHSAFALSNTVNILAADATLGPDGAIYVAATKNASVVLARFTGTEGPQALVNSPEHLTLGAATTLRIAVTYRSTSGIDLTSVSRTDIHLRRQSDNLTLTPHSFTNTASGPDPEFDTVIYKFVFLPSDLGVYDVQLVRKQIFDQAGFPATSRFIGKITIT